MQRRVVNSEHIVQRLAELFATDEEVDGLLKRLKPLEETPKRGASRFKYRDDDERFWAVKCGRFLIIYQFTDTEVKLEDVLL